MSKGKSNKVTFKTYDPDQAFLLPPSLEDLVPQNHMVRMVNKTIDQLNIDPLIKSYKGGGASIYHPKMMIKVLVYAYLSQIYSSRKIAKALRQDTHFMWLSGMNKPDFRTINIFRSSRLKPVIDQVFGSMVKLCQEMEYIKLENYFIDGTKIAANAGRNSYVWKKNVKRYKASTEEQIRKLLDHIEQVNQQENLDYGERDLEELGENTQITSEKIKAFVNKLNEQISEKKQTTGLSKGDKEVAKTVKQLEKDRLPKLEQYEQQEKDLSGRNSCSKTDIDATFLRLKNGLLRPSYNILVGSENQFILNHSIHQNAGDSGLFIDHMKKLKSQLGNLPSNAIGDAAFGTEENYSFLDQHTIGNYLKYGTFHSDQTNKHKQDKFSKDKFVYTPESDTYQCPSSRNLHFKEEKETKTDNGYISHVKIYACEDCSGCSFANQCKKGQANRSIQINTVLDQYRSKAYSNLTSEQGIKLRKQRNTEPETVFGNIKWNLKFNRFGLRGKDKVNTEMGLICIAHNIMKIYKIELNKTSEAAMTKQKSEQKTATYRYFCFYSDLVH
ncbi:MAG: IS1182 family transposase [Bacteroidota bacterium]|nr:IS1182 family transposase [Bacteroidota bacterium]